MMLPAPIEELIIDYCVGTSDSWRINFGRVLLELLDFVKQKKRDKLRERATLYFFDRGLYMTLGTDY